MLFRGRRKREITVTRIAISNAKAKGRKASAQVLQNNSPPGADICLIELAWPIGKHQMNKAQPMTDGQSEKAAMRSAPDARQ
jgi:hypothetical protein